MGIRGLNEELRSCGETQALAKLAIDHLEKTGRPLRIAVDISIWMFQLRSAQGGFSPELRTLFYRLIRLLSLAIEPIFVFDGPNKPKTKRNKNSARSDTASAATAQAKRIIRMFGLPFHDAPGEAEAECALLQQRGVVDAVLSEDVDTIMFGCTHTMRFVRSQRPGQPTHIISHRADRIREEQQLDREGMVLIALLSGGDYDTDGVENCGVKVASEAARAGFGRSLCALKAADSDGIRRWRENLQHELATNESRFFRQRHKALKIPDSFPNLEILRYYTHPVVSSSQKIDQLGRLLASNWAKPIIITEMRHLTEEFFDWGFKGGALKLIRVISPCIFVQKLLQLSRDSQNDSLCIEEREKREAGLIKKIKSRRLHESTDHIPELRVEYIPLDIAGLDISHEREAEIITTRNGLATNSDDEFLASAADGDAEKPVKVYDPSVGTLAWVPELLVRLGAPLAVEDFDETTQPQKQISELLDQLPELPKLPKLPNSRQSGDIDSGLWAKSRQGQQRITSAIEILSSSPVKPRQTSFRRSNSTIPTTKASKASESKASAQRPLNPWAASGTKDLPRYTKTAHAPTLAKPPPQSRPHSLSPKSQLTPVASIELPEDFVRLDIPELPPSPKFAPYNPPLAGPHNPNPVESRPHTPEQPSQSPILINSSPEYMATPPRRLTSSVGLPPVPQPVCSSLGNNTKRDSNSLSSSGKSPSKISCMPTKKRAFQQPAIREQTGLDIFLSSSPPQSSPQIQSQIRNHGKENTRPSTLTTATTSRRISIVVLSDDEEEDSFLPLDKVPKASSLTFEN
ncbi:Flap endonuclease 1 [Ceratocystis fimbriata CBS 114723]|uniref:Flap endonuclease 1 n=1 Tax=Ceratocystis fimbriata CBS 114723 TaxID=1035309 RepID=A0A2C5X0U8_9PEZI|nr:Flap endonuclease 1 [Ceratocystis fimbriata CBS 114723]